MVAINCHRIWIMNLHHVSVYSHQDREGIICMYRDALFIAKVFTAVVWFFIQEFIYSLKQLRVSATSTPLLSSYDDCCCVCVCV